MSTDLFRGEHVAVTRFFAGRNNGVAYQITASRALNPGTERYCQLTPEGVGELLLALIAIWPRADSRITDAD